MPRMSHLTFLHIKNIPKSKACSFWNKVSTIWTSPKLGWCGRGVSYFTFRRQSNVQGFKHKHTDVGRLKRVFFFLRKSKSQRWKGIQIRWVFCCSNLKKLTVECLSENLPIKSSIFPHWVTQMKSILTQWFSVVQSRQIELTVQECSCYHHFHGPLTCKLATFFFPSLKLFFLSSDERKSNDFCPLCETWHLISAVWTVSPLV